MKKEKDQMQLEKKWSMISTLNYILRLMKVDTLTKLQRFKMQNLMMNYDQII